MVPQEHPPRFPLRMVGGGSLPAYLLQRSGTPLPWEELVFRGEGSEEELAGIGGGNATRAFDLAVESGTAPGTVAPPTTPVGSDDGARGGDRVAPPRATAPSPAPAPPAAAAATAAATPAPAPAAAGAGAGGAGPSGRGSRWQAASPVTSAGLYGQAFVVGQGHLHFETTSRMEDW
jgi:hypothetical protein